MQKIILYKKNTQKIIKKFKKFPPKIKKKYFIKKIFFQTIQKDNRETQQGIIPFKSSNIKWPTKNIPQKKNQNAMHHQRNYSSTLYFTHQGFDVVVAIV